MVVRVCIDAQHSPFVTSLAFPQGIAPGENIELYIGTWDLPESPPPKANTIVVDPLTKVVHVARKLDVTGKRKAVGDPSGADRKKVLVAQKPYERLAGTNSGPGYFAKAGNNSNSVGGAKNKCGECGQVFDNLKEISVHMQRHLAEKVPQEKHSIVTLTHRPKDGSAPSRATITQDPNYRNRVEVSIPLTAAESFLETVLDQAQQILLKYIRPPAGGTLEVRKTDSYKEGDANRSVILEALEQVNSAGPPAAAAAEATPPQKTAQSGPPPEGLKDFGSSSSSSYVPSSAAPVAPNSGATTAAERSEPQEIDDVERALEAIHAGADELSGANAPLQPEAGPSFNSQEHNNVAPSPELPVMMKQPLIEPPNQDAAADKEDNNDSLQQVPLPQAIPVEQGLLPAPQMLPELPQINEDLPEGRRSPVELNGGVAQEPVLEPPQNFAADPQGDGVVQQELRPPIAEAAPQPILPQNLNNEPQNLNNEMPAGPVEFVQNVARDVMPAVVQPLRNPDLLPGTVRASGSRLFPQEFPRSSRARDDGMQDEIGSSSEAVAATPHRLSRSLMDPREPTSSADVDSTVGEADGGQASPDDGGVDSTSASSSSSNLNGPPVARERLGGGEPAEAARAQGAGHRGDGNIVLNEAAARVAERFHQAQPAPNNQAGALDLMGGYGLQDEIQEPHSGMQ